MNDAITTRMHAIRAWFTRVRKERTNPRTSAAELQRQSRVRLNAIASQAAHEQRAPTAAEVDELAHTDALLAALKASNPGPWSSPWLLATGVLLVVGVAGVLSAVRVDQTVVDFDARVSEASFTVPVPTSVLEGSDLTSVQSSGFDHLLVQKSVTEPADLMPSSLYVATLSGVGAGRITLNELLVPAGTRFVFERTAAGTVQLDLYPAQRQEVTLRMTVTYADVSVPQRSGSAKVIRLRSPDGLSVTETSQDHLSLALSSTGDVSVAARRDIPIASLSLVESDSQSLAVSTIDSGSVFFEHLNGKTHTLRKGELVEIGSSAGTLRSLRTVSTSPVKSSDSADALLLDMAFSGTISGMRSGVAAADESLMPTQLEWLNAQPWLGLLWGTIVSGVALVLGVQKFLSSRSVG